MLRTGRGLGPRDPRVGGHSHSHLKDPEQEEGNGGGGEGEQEGQGRARLSLSGCLQSKQRVGGAGLGPSSTINKG